MEEEEGYFEFETVNEEEEELDFQHLKECPHCKNPIPQNALRCLYCGEEVSNRGSKKLVVIIAIIVLISFLGLILLR